MIAPARQISYRILSQIETSDAHSDELLRSPEVDALSAVDRNLTTTLVMGTLRWQLALDARIRQLLARPDAKLGVEAATALRMGAYQLLHLERVPAHAVIHDSVELVKQGPERGAAGMVNAVLRAIQRTEKASGQRLAESGQERRPTADSAQDSAIQRTALSGRRTERASGQRLADSGQKGPPTADMRGRELAGRWAHPEWMVERWVRQYGADAAEAICRWDQEPAGVTLRVEPGVELSGIETEAAFFLSDARRLVRGDIGRSRAFGEGAVRVQDEGSQLITEIAAAAAENATKVLDTCAAPGGKTAILAERLPEAAITAVDVSRKRLEGMRRILPGAIAGRVTFEVADATKIELKPEWDLIVCDVPCSGTGTMARNPEIRLRLAEFDLKRQQERQIAILRAALTGLAPGGVLVYSTCSLESEENEAVIERVINNVDGFTLRPVRPILVDLTERGVVTRPGIERLESAVQGPFLRTIPGVHPCDGFFAAIFERR